jgi:hypothetical protein
MPLASLNFAWRRRPLHTSSDGDNNTSTNPSSDDLGEGEEVKSDGTLKYTFAKGGNDSPPAYQEASGAPVESRSPLGYAVGPATIVFLNVSKMVGTGVYSTRESSLRSFLPSLLFFSFSWFLFLFRGTLLVSCGFRRSVSRESEVGYKLSL